MGWLGVAAAVALILVALVDSFEAIILPRRVTTPSWLRLFYRSAWSAVAGAWPELAGWGGGATASSASSARSRCLRCWPSWARGLILGFALLHWSLGTPLSAAPDADGTFGIYLYFSGTTFFTLGYGDVVPVGALGRALAWSRRASASASWRSSSATCRCSTRRSRAARSPSRCSTPAPARRPRAGELLPAAGRGAQPGRRRPAPGRVGALGGRGAGEPPLVPGAELLPLAARQPVLAGGADGDPRHLGAGHRRRWTGRTATRRG